MTKEDAEVIKAFEGYMAARNANEQTPERKAIAPAAQLSVSTGDRTYEALITAQKAYEETPEYKAMHDAWAFYYKLRKDKEIGI